MRLLSLIVLLMTTLNLNGQQSDSVFIRKIFNEALSRGHAYEDLRSLCKDVGARLTGSAEAAMAVQWGRHKMEAYDFDSVYLQEITVPHWERGTTEAGWIKHPEGQLIKVHLLALGGSVGTNGLIEGEVVEFKHIDSLKNSSREEVEGKIVFLNQPMDEQMINTFRAYGACYPIRGHGASEAAVFGAKAVIIRSLGLPLDHHPHTGSMQYKEGVDKIPAAALSTLDAEKLSDMIRKEGTLRFAMEMDCRNFPDQQSHNVIGEMRGQKSPEKIITFGGHLDSWDTGEGAHDDGAGIVHSLEALRILKELGYQSRHTLRLVFFMNEENGNMGGKSYAQIAYEKGEQHIAALESDRGGLTPRGFSCDGNETQQAMNRSFALLFKPYLLHKFEEGYGGVDISPLKDYYPDIALFGFLPDSQRYFDFHHAPSDVFENVNKRELELGAASMAAMIYLVDNYVD